jgi:hypothetical protein
MAIAISLVVAALALAFTLGSFWWLHARKGSITVATPRSYAFARQATKSRLRLPLTFFNTGARALIVDDLRITLGDQSHSPLGWISTRATLRPNPDDVSDFATPLAVQGRSTREVIAEFGDDLGWSPAAGSRRRLQLQAQIHPEDNWVDVLVFDWLAPPTDESMNQYIAHRNDPS